MKKTIAIASFIAMLVAVAGCSENGNVGVTDFDISEEVPILVNRAILTDAVWGEGEGIPQDAACVAGSQFIIDAVDNPTTIKKNATGDPLHVTDAVITTSLNINIPDDEFGKKGESCASGDLNYLVSASDENPIDVEAIGESCPNLGDTATEEGVAFPNAGTSVDAHFEPQEVVEIIGECEDEDSPTCVKTTKKMFKLVVDECYTVEAE